MRIVIITLIVMAFIIGMFIAYRGRSVTDAVIGPINLDNQNTNTQSKLASKTDDQASVAITVKPIGFSPGLKEWKFDVRIDTHSVELSQDMIKAMVLIDEAGREYWPIRWEGTESGGHHREGTIVFTSITPMPKSIELKIINIGVPARSFRWKLTN